MLFSITFCRFHEKVLAIKLIALKIKDKVDYCLISLKIASNNKKQLFRSFKNFQHEFKFKYASNYGLNCL